MSKLGYTWYPKDWSNSDNVFELTLCERGLYRELIDFAMLNNNTTEIKINVWSRKFQVSISELNLILDKLLLLNIIEIKENILFIPSCESRLNLVRGGSIGGKKSKPIPKPILKPMSKPIPKPIPKQREIEREREREIESKLNIKENINSIDFYFKDLETSTNFENISKFLNIPKDKLTLKIPEFRKKTKVQYQNFNDFCNHFKNFANLTNTSNLKLKTSFK